MMNKKPLWSDENNLNGMLNTKDDVILNLYEDIQCLKEELAFQKESDNFRVDILNLKVKILIKHWPDSDIQHLEYIVDQITKAQEEYNGSI